MSSTEEDAEDCPICCNDLDLTDRSIQYCACGCKWTLFRLHIVLLHERLSSSCSAAAPFHFIMFPI